MHSKQLGFPKKKNENNLLFYLNFEIFSDSDNFLFSYGIFIEA